MKMFLYIILVITMLALRASNGFAQSKRDDTAGNSRCRYEPWATIIKSDVLWYKEVWREIDIYQKTNVALRNYPTISEKKVLARILLDGIKSGEIKAYDNDSIFTTPLTTEGMDSALLCHPAGLSIYSRAGINYANWVKDSVLAPEKHTAYGNYDTSAVRECVYPEQVDYYRIREEWIFDKSVGQMVVRIRALGLKANGNASTMFWLSYPDIRKYLSMHESSYRENNESFYSWDEFFENRKFTSKITKLGKNHDTFNKNLDMWEY